MDQNAQGHAHLTAINLAVLSQENAKQIEMNHYAKQDSMDSTPRTETSPSANAF